MFKEEKKVMQKELDEFKVSITRNITWFNQKVRDWKPIIGQSSSSS